jgi:pentatricopeptide repeat protein
MLYFRDMVNSNHFNISHATFLDLFSRCKEGEMVLHVWNNYFRGTILVIDKKSLVEKFPSNEKWWFRDEMSCPELHFFLNVLNDKKHVKKHDSTFFPTSISTEVMLNIFIDFLGYNQPFQLAPEVFEKYMSIGYSLNLNHFNSLIECLARNGSFDEAWKWILKADLYGKKSNYIFKHSKKMESN